MAALRPPPLQLTGETGPADGLLGAAEIRRLAAELDLRPTKTLGQNFLLDANTVRRIVRVAGVTGDDVVLEVGPGLGSLTLGLLPAARRVVAVEIDPRLAALLPRTCGRVAGDLEVVTADALTLTALPGAPPTALVANLPYNVAVPVVLTLLERFPTISRGLVMVQQEVADRLTAPSGSRVYGAPSVKLAWYAAARQAGSVSRSVFWPAPNVDSGLVAFAAQPPPTGADRTATFAVVDAAFAQRRKTLRAALAGWAGSAPAAEEILRRAGVDPGLRGEALGVGDFAKIASARAP
ncbi:MAG TPA: 16S rRNA (adenine(1518)-N(6)/adenine(1519)-N(6))-dimethyltransferase RsmA [Mycobacteriales bacterium]|nr:16S rRNA (adenine(1518)-N(6)/adenine(1519)-N(6))-dimethyltransferase RsmA [Mycobacteriales bacterium]